MDSLSYSLARERERHVPACIGCGGDAIAACCYCGIAGCEVCVGKHVSVSHHDRLDRNPWSGAPIERETHATDGAQRK
jgi:hypothetical protein